MTYIAAFLPLAQLVNCHLSTVNCQLSPVNCHQDPGQKEELFSCGEMGRRLEGTKQAAPCARGQQILYAWAMNAPKLELPRDVGFKVMER